MTMSATTTGTAPKSTTGDTLARKRRDGRVVRGGHGSAGRG
jgi:hypothetical protein